MNSRSSLPENFKQPGMSDFPFKRLSTPFSVVLKKFSALKSYKPVFCGLPFTIKNIPGMTSEELVYNGNIPGEFHSSEYPPVKGQQVILKLNPSDYFNYDDISDYFNEPRRIHVHHKNKPSTLEYWQRNKSRVRNQAQKMTRGKITEYELREALYKLNYEPTAFRNTITCAFTELFQAKSGFSMSEGYGDRLISAMAKMDFYTGIDPDGETHKGYEEITKALAPHSQCKVELIQAPFEEAELSRCDYDMHIASPPYFAYEIYSQDENQSVNRFPEFEAWYNNFLIFSIKKTLQAVKPGGVSIIIINDSSTEPPFVKRMIAEIQELDFVEYLGCIAYAEITKKPDLVIRRPQPCWIFKRAK